MENQKLDFPNSSFVLLHNFLPILITPPPDYGFVWWSSQEPAHFQYPIPISLVTLVSFDFLSLYFKKRFSFFPFDPCLETQQFIHIIINFLTDTDWQGKDHIFIALDCCIGLLVGPAFPAIFFFRWVLLIFVFGFIPD